MSCTKHLCNFVTVSKRMLLKRFSFTIILFDIWWKASSTNIQCSTRDFLHGNNFYLLVFVVVVAIIFSIFFFFIVRPSIHIFIDTGIVDGRFAYSFIWDRLNSVSMHFYRYVAVFFFFFWLCLSRSLLILYRLVSCFAFDRSYSV